MRRSPANEVAPELKAPELWGGIECTMNRVGDRFHSQLARRTPRERLADIDRLAALGIRTLRWPLLWEELAPRDPQEIDWKLADPQMQRLRENGIRPIVGMVHHGSGPSYTNLLDPAFPRLLANYARAIAERYPWVDAYTPVNEPLTTARFSGLYGHWFPHGRDPLTFCRALLNQVRAIASAMRAIRTAHPAAKLVQTEDLGVTLSTPALAYQAEFENERRWLPFDLLTGTLDPAGPVWSYLCWAGISEDDLLQILANPCPPDVLGVNHYITSSRFLDENTQSYAPEQIGSNGRDHYADVAAVRVCHSFCEPRDLLREAWLRFRIPIAVTEVHLGCTREEQLRWFSEIWNAAVELRRERIPIAAVTAWSLLGAFDWDSLLTRAAGHYEVGAFDLQSFEPRPTALAHLLQEVCITGECRHPLFGAPGWWRRDVRFLGRVPEPASPPSVFTPRGNAGCPMLLIVGANGVLNHALARICHLRGLPFRLLSRAEIDITNADAVCAAIRAFRPWALIHADLSRNPKTREPGFDCEHRLAARSLTAACGAADVALLTFSGQMFCEALKSRNTRRGPVDLTQVCDSTADHSPRVISSSILLVRTGELFGPWNGDDFISHTVASLKLGEAVNVAENAWVSPTYVPDLVHAALDLLIDRERGTWHLANAGAVSSMNFVRAIARIAGFDESLVRGSGSGDVPFTWPPRAKNGSGGERVQHLGSWEEALHRYFHDRSERRTSAPCGQAPEPVTHL